MTEITRASFLATIAPIMSGIKTGSDGMRVQFDVPESEMGEAVKLLAMRGRVLRLTVEVADTSKGGATGWEPLR
jgi:hypothetical protein